MRMCVDDVVGKKIVRGLYNYEPSTVNCNGTDDTQSDLCFKKGDLMVVLSE